MVTFSSNPAPAQSPHGDGRYLLHMLLGQRTAPSPEMLTPPEEQVIGPPRQLGELPSDVYVDDPANTAEVNPLAPPLGGTRPLPTNTPTARPVDPGITNVPKPAPVNHGLYNTPVPRPDVALAQSPSQEGVMSIMDNMRTMLDGNTASANTAIDNIDGNPAPAGDDDSSWWSTLAKGGLAAALIAAILTGRGRSASGVSSPSTGISPYDPGMSGTILGRDRLTGPSASSPSPAQLETDILSATPNTLPRQQTGVATRPNDTPVPQGKPQSVTPDVINQGGPNAQRGLTSQGVQYRGRTYFMDEAGNVTDRNGDIVNTSSTETIKKLFARKNGQ